MGATYPTYYSSLPRDAKVLMQFVSALNGTFDGEAKKKEAIARASLRIAKITTELEAITRFLELKEAETHGAEL